MAKVFLSYDREDAAKARTVAQLLERAGNTVWWDRNIKGGAQYSKEIETALADADSVVVLWSPSSIDSAWVRDEAAAGRDSGRLVPVMIEPTTPPMGFRQYQTIDFTGRKARSKLAQSELIGAVGEGKAGPSSPASTIQAIPAGPNPLLRRGLSIAIAALLLLGAGYFAWTRFGQIDRATLVSVEAADSSPESRGLARNLLVKLGVLQGNSETSVRLLDQSGTGNKPDIFISIGGSTSGGKAHATLTMTSTDEKLILWSKEFVQSDGTQADLEEAIAFAAAQVLTCANEVSSGKHGALDANARRIYLNACSSAADVGWDTTQLVPMFRSVLKDAPNFRPAWSRLLLAEIGKLQIATNNEEATDPIKFDLQRDIAAARKLDPKMPEATIAEINLAPAMPVGRVIALLDEAKAYEPDNSTVLTERANAMQRVGRMNDGIVDAQRAAELEPLSPDARSTLIGALSAGNRVEAARAELEQAKKLWPATKTVQQAEFGLELRYGDFEKALRSPEGGWSSIAQAYSAARKDPTDANVARYLAVVNANQFNLGLIQPMTEMKRVDQFYKLLDNWHDDSGLSQSTYILFRPGVAPARRDPRFMLLAKRAGLIAYWQQTGIWPEFCRDPDLPYDCKAEAAKYAP